MKRDNRPAGNDFRAQRHHRVDDSHHPRPPEQPARARRGIVVPARANQPGLYGCSAQSGVAATAIRMSDYQTLSAFSRPSAAHGVKASGESAAWDGGKGCSTQAFPGVEVEAQ